MGRTERGDCFIPLHSTCTVKMQSRHARRRIHHVCECTRGKRTAEGRARRVRLPLSTPLRYQPWLDIINGNAIFSSAMQFRIPLSRIRSSVLYADLSIPLSLLAPLPSPLFLFLFLSLHLIRAIHLSLLTHAVILYTFHSFRSANQSSE